MTVPSQTMQVRHDCDGVSTSFPVPFYFLANSDLNVVLTDSAGIQTALVLGTDFNVTGAGNPSGGELTTTEAYPSGSNLYIWRVVPITQETAYQANDPFPERAHERALDKLTMICQQLGRIIGFPPGIGSRALLLGDADVDGSGAYQANGNRIKDLGDPVSMDDAINKQYLIDRLADLAADGSGQFVVERLADTTDPDNGVAMIGGAVQIVKTVSAIRSLKKTNPSIWAKTSGYYAEGDGGEAFYYLDSTDTTSADDGFKVIVASDGGRWKINHNGIFSVQQAGVKGDGVTDDVARFQVAVDALQANQVLRATGSFLMSEEVFIKGSNITLDFRAAKFIQSGTTYTGYGSGFFIGDPTNKPLVPENVTILGGEYYPAGNAQAYPLADFNPIAVVAGTHIVILNPKIYPKQSTRAISVQADNTYGDGVNPPIDGVLIDGLEVYGDGNAVDGLDITADGRDDLIRNVTVRGKVFGCKRGANISAGNDSYNFNYIDVSLEINGASEVAANLLRVRHGNFNISATGCTKTGVDCRQLENCYVNAKLEGSGGSLLNAFAIVDGVGTAQNTFDVQATGPWTNGVAAGAHDCVYRNVEIDGATVGINSLGFRTSWGTVILRNCTTSVDDLEASTDEWGLVIEQIGTNAPTILKRSFDSTDNAVERYGIDLHNTSTVTLAAGATTTLFGAVAAFSGMLLVNGTAGTGSPALFVCGGAVTYLAGGDTSTYSTTGGTASRVNVYYDGSNRIAVQNNLAVSVTLRFFSVRMRNSA